MHRSEGPERSLDGPPGCLGWPAPRRELRGPLRASTALFCRDEAEAPAGAGAGGGGAEQACAPRGGAGKGAGRGPESL